MSGLHEAFDEIVADVPVYGDLDAAIRQVDQERRHRYGVVASMVAAAAAVAVIVGVLAVTRGGDGAPRPTGPLPTPTQSPTQTKSQSPQTWVDVPVRPRQGTDWTIPDLLAEAQASWFPVVVDHLDPGVGRLEPEDFGPSVEFSWPADGSPYSYEGDGSVALLTDRGPFEDGCYYLGFGPPPASNGTESCSTERLTGPHGERARISRYQRLCGAVDGSAASYATCGDYRAAVAVERRDGLIGYLVVNGRGYSEYNPFSAEAMVAAAADPRMSVPRAALAVPSSQTAASVLSDHFPRWREDPALALVTYPAGTAVADGMLGPNSFVVRVGLAGEDPVCGRTALVECVERRVYGADDPTTVFVGAWDDHEVFAPSRVYIRQLVYVGPRHTVSVSLGRVVRKHEDGIGTGLDRRVIDLLLDPRLQ